MRITKDKTKESLFLDEMALNFDALYNFAFYISKNNEMAKDLVQETLLKAYRYFDYYEKGTNAKSWLFKILQNIYINEYRKTNRRPAKITFEDTDIDYDRFSAYSYEMLENVVGDDVMTALEELSPELRNMIILKDIQGFKYEEISKIFDVPLGTTKNRLFRARNQMKKKLIKLGYNKNLN